MKAAIGLGCVLLLGAAFAAEGPDETARWQAAIDAAATAGGGTVRVPAGSHFIGTLELRSNVTLELAKDAVLEGLSDPKLYRGISRPDTEIPACTGLIVAGFATNVAIRGEGTVDGHGERFPPKGRPRFRGLVFYRCRGVELKDFTLREPGSWSCHFKECVGVHVDGVRLDSHANYNNDGFDIEAQDVLIENCDIDVGDDAICPKSQSAIFEVRNIEVRNCVIRSCCAAIKFGCETSGAGFRDICVHDCRIERCARGWYDPKEDGDTYREGAPYSFPGACGDFVNIGAIVVQTLDGAPLENFTARNLDIAETMTPIFVRCGFRRRPATRGGVCEPFGSGWSLRNVLFENIRARVTSHVASAVLGVNGMRPSGITFRNVDIVCKGAGASRTEAARALKEIDEAGANTGTHLTYFPAYGVYMRHADDVTFENVRLRYSGDFEERPPVIAEDCRNFREDGCSYQPPRSPAPGEAFLRIGVVTELEGIEKAFEEFRAAGADAIVVSGCVGPETSDETCRSLRATRDRIFDGVDRPEVLYRYTGYMPPAKRVLLDANGMKSLREYKSTGVLVYSEGVDAAARRTLEDRVNNFEFYAKTVLVFDGTSAAERKKGHSIVSLTADPIPMAGKTYLFNDENVRAQTTMVPRARDVLRAPGFRGAWESRPLKLEKGERIAFAIDGDPDFRRTEFIDLQGRRVEGESLYAQPVKLRVIAESSDLRAFASVHAPSVPAFRWTKPGPAKFLARRAAEVKAAAGLTFDLVMLGDSLSHNWENGKNAEVYAELTNRYSVLNLGIAGDKVENLLWRCENGQLDGYAAKNVMLLIGTNDLNWYPSLSPTSGEIVAGIAKILDLVAAKLPGARLIMLPVFPRGEKADDPFRAQVASLNRLIRAEAERRGATWIDFTGKFVEPNGTISSATMKDFLHIGPAGYRVWLEAIEKTLK